jgi:hypothetical protein
MRPKLSYANVMATIAVFIALGGASYAALKLPKNSVGTKQLKKNAVTTAKIKKEAVTAGKVKQGTLTGTQINASTLGTVPTAQTANRAKTANGLAAPEPWHDVGAAGEPQFRHGCHNFGGIWPTVAFYKDAGGVVHLKGTYVSCSALDEIAFELPAGFRPAQLQVFPLAGSSSEVEVWPSESLFEQNNATPGAVRCGDYNCNLNGITFRAES